MAAAVGPNGTPLPIPVAADPVSPPTLNRYVELLPDSNYAWWQGAWNATSYALVVAYITGAVALTIFTGLVTPIYLPVITVCIYAMVPYAYSGFEYFQGLAAKQGYHALIEQGVAEKLSLVPENDSHLVNQLTTFGIDAKNIKGIPENEIQRMRPLIARYSFWRDLSSKNTQAAEQLRASLKEGDLLAQLQIMQLREEAQSAKAYAAYFRGIILNPLFLGELKEVFQSNFIPIQSQLMKQGLAHHFNEPSKYVVINHPDGKPRFALEELEKMHDEDLRQEFFRAQPAQV